MQGDDYEPGSPDETEPAGGSEIVTPGGDGPQVTFGEGDEDD